MKTIHHINSFETFFYVGGVALFFGLIYLFLCRKNLVSILDPLIFFIISITFTSTIVVFTVSNPVYIFQFFSFIFLFFIGLNYYKIKNIRVHPGEVLKINSPNFAILEISIIIISFVYILGNIYFFSLAGIPFFSDSPTESKIMNYYQFNFAWLRRINWGIGSFMNIISLVFVFFSKKYKKLFLVITLANIFINLFQGGKGSILVYLTILVLLVNNQYFKNYINFTKVPTKYKISFVLFLILGVFSAIYVLMIESKDHTNPLFVVMQKLYFFGDIIIYFYRPVNLEYFKDYNPVDYLSHVLNPILGLLRLAPYETPFGHIILKNYLLKYQGIELKTLIGPNSYFYIEGFIFFGIFGGMIYSFLLGILISYIRYTFFKTKTILKFCILLFLNVFIFRLPMDISYYITTLLDSIYGFIFILPLAIIIYLVIKTNPQRWYE